MQKSPVSVVILSLIIGTLLLSGCNPDDDNALNVDPRDNYTGTWKVQDSNKKLAVYYVQITANPDNSSQVFISNFYDFQIKPYAIVTSSTITLPTQTFTKSLEIRGSGTLNNNVINWTYYVNDGADLDTIHSVYTRQ